MTYMRGLRHDRGMRRDSPWTDNPTKPRVVRRGQEKRASVRVRGHTHTMTARPACTRSRQVQCQNKGMFKHGSGRLSIVNRGPEKVFSGGAGPDVSQNASCVMDGSLQKPQQTRTHTHTAHTRWDPRDKKEARKAVERKLLGNSRAVLDVLRFGEEADNGDMFSAGAKQPNLPPSPDHQNSPRRSPCAHTLNVTNRHYKGAECKDSCQGSVMAGHKSSA